LCEIATGWHHLGGYVLGAALYRAGKFEESIECFEKEAKSFQPRAWEWSFLAMAHRRLGHDAEARRCLREAVQWIDAANARTEDNLRLTEPAWADSHEPVMVPLLLREAQELVNGSVSQG
jgi:tetratricopeptide (TPR) repeat protein